MRFLGRCLLFAGALFSGSPVGVLSQTPSLCQTVATGAQLELGNFPGLSTATINLPAGVTLPAQLQSCISPTSSTGQILAVVFQVLKTQGTTYNPDTTVWAAAGWPTPAVRIPTVAEYGMFVSMAGTLGIVSATSGAGAGSGTINIGVGTGATGNLNPALVPACAGQTVQYCETYCSNPANTAACLQGFLGGLLSGLGSLSGINVVVGGGTGGSGNGLNPPPFIPPNINDILRQYQAAAGPLGICSVSCPNNLMCIGSRCIPPQPLCNPPCTGGQFCRPQLNAASLATFNANAAAGAYASQSQGSAGAQGSISVNDAQIMPGGIVSGTCVSFTPVCNSTSCPSGQVCAPFDGCKPCAACGNVTGVDLTPLMAGGFDPSQLTGNFTLPPGQNPGQGQQIAAGIIAQIQGGTSQYGTVVFGASAGSSASTGDAATAVAGGARASADSLLANIRDAALQLGADAQFVANQIRVAVNSTLEVVLAAQNSQAGASSSVAINGPLVIRGPGAQVDPNNFTPQGVFNFPPSSSGNTVGGGAVVNAAGGVGLTGDLGSLTLSINAIASAAAAVAVPAGQWLRSSGQVLGGAAQVIVQGILELHNSAFQPAVTVTGSGNVTVSVGSTGNFSCGSLAIQAGGKLDLWSSGGSTYFANFTRCDASALIRIRVASIASLKTSGGSGIAFGYGAVNSTVKASLRCGAQLYDGTDSITLTNPNAANPNTGRRLLAAGDGSQITFQAQSAVYTVPSSSGGSNSVSAVAPAAGLVVVILATIVAILA